MTREEYLALAASRYDELEKLKEKDNFYDYEKGFDEIWRDLGRQYMETRLNEKSTTSDRRKKNVNPLRRDVDSEKQPLHAGA
ncbi:MAG: hypothetical protein LBR10_01810 [Prevotellaceae bacterium]|jgi:hypothetical protein|nr:hypothetical protein [Prevotellaceae bacterium]